MAKHQSPFAAKRIEDLLQSASDLLKVYSIEALTLAKISKHAKANSALVRYYFGCKNGLLESLIERDLGKLEKCLTVTRIDFKEDHLANLRLYIFCLNDYLSEFTYLTSLIRHTVRNDKNRKTRLIVKKYILLVYSTCLKELKGGLTAGIIRDLNSRDFFILIFGILTSDVLAGLCGESFSRFVGNQSDCERLQRAEAISFLLKGVIINQSKNPHRCARG